MSSELFEKGLAVRKEVLGSAYVEKSIGGADGRKDGGCEEELGSDDRPN